MPKTAKDGYTRFTLVSIKGVRTKSMLMHIKVDVSIRAEGKLAETVVNRASVGRIVRVVGSLDNEGKSLIIDAEHIEFRPEVPDAG
jgi:hypothetical protein